MQLKWRSSMTKNQNTKITSIEDPNGDGAPLRAVDWERTKTLAVKTVKRVGPIYALQLGIKELYKSCQSYSEGDSSTAEACIGGAIVTVASIASHFDKIVDWVGEFAQDTKWAFFEAGVVKLAPWAGRVIASMGTYMSPRGLLESRAARVRRAEAALSAEIGLDIRHIGFLDRSTQGSDQHLGKRQGSEPTPVFAVSKDGRHMHFAAARDPETGEMRIRTGFGPGVETEANVAGLHARSINRPQFNKQHFDGGGLDLVGHSKLVSEEGPDDGAQPSPEDPDAFNALYDAFACYLHIGDAAGMEDFPGLWWQIYDSVSEGTLVAGAIAPFLGEDASIISWLRPEGGLEVRDDCIAVMHDEL